MRSTFSPIPVIMNDGDGGVRGAKTLDIKPSNLGR